MYAVSPNQMHRSNFLEKEGNRVPNPRGEGVAGTGAGTGTPPTGWNPTGTNANGVLVTRMPPIFERGVWADVIKFEGTSGGTGPNALYQMDQITDQPNYNGETWDWLGETRLLDGQVGAAGNVSAFSMRIYDTSGGTFTPQAEWTPSFSRQAIPDGKTFLRHSYRFSWTGLSLPIFFILARRMPQLVRYFP